MANLLHIILTILLKEDLTMKNNVSEKLNKMIDRQNSITKCGCEEVMRKKDFSHHAFFCPVGSEVPVTDFDVSTFVRRENVTEKVAC
jgi:hypothetical protein